MAPRPDNQPGAQIMAELLHRYDPDPRSRITRFVSCLDDYCDENDLDLQAIVRIVHSNNTHRRNAKMRERLERKTQELKDGLDGQ